jgi:universal stress protein E
MHLKMGDPAFQLPILARSLRARAVVMGAVSRSPVKRALIGSTAERVLDAMPCDILIVKPKEFRAA